jgi:hypothetical protein
LLNDTSYLAEKMQWNSVQQQQKVRANRNNKGAINKPFAAFSKRIASCSDSDDDIGFNFNHNLNDEIAIHNNNNNNNNNNNVNIASTSSGEDSQKVTVSGNQFLRLIRTATQADDLIEPEQNTLLSSMHLIGSASLSWSDAVSFEIHFTVVLLSTQWSYVQLLPIKFAILDAEVAGPTSGMNCR